MKLFVINSELSNPRHTNSSFTLNQFGFEEAQCGELKLHILTRPGVAGAVLRTPLTLIWSVIKVDKI